MTLSLDDLNPAQRDAVTTTEGPLLVLAGAGSGKTRVLTYRIAHLIGDRGISPASILAITFTNKAAAEMRGRLVDLIGPSARPMWVMTFHAFCVRLLRADGGRLGYSRSFSIYDDDDSRRLLTSALAELDLDQKMHPPKAIAGRISAAKNELLGPDAYRERAVIPPEKVAARVYELYQRRLAAANAMDFDDLLVNAERLLRENPDVLEFYQDRFGYVHVDEYQDTNHAQYEIVKRLASRDRNLMVVGDDDQSIYSWRGADIRNILEFERDYSDATVIRLEQNYRSTATILAAANAVVANNTGRKPKTLWTTNVGGEAITRYSATDERDEARFIAEEVERLLRSEHRSYADFAVFYRTNAQSRVIEDLFLRAGVPYRLVGGTRFFERAEIRDVMAWLRATVNPADTQSLVRVLEKRAGIGKTTIDTLRSRADSEGITLTDAIGRADEAGWLATAPARKVAMLADDLRRAREADGETLRARVEDIVSASGLLGTLRAEGTSEAAGRIENIQEFFGVVDEYDAQHEDSEARTLEAFLEWVALRSDLDEVADDDRAVTMMTLHAAKGLEYPVVFLPGMEDMIFPHASAIFEPTGLEEERRLCYVGITRARERLYILHASSRMLFGQTQYNQPSRFIEEIPDEHLKLEGVGSAGFGSSAPGRGRGDRGGSVRWGGGSRDGVPEGGRVFGSGARTERKAEERLELAAGDVVDHKVFGRGVVQSISGDKVSVTFPDGGTKNLLLGYAPIRKVES
ncbi:MAG: UvrD-helicase domain-containing protein [Coriobacteriia bacterium]|nr:UvrD-helicase domain-containing protein [Coriobacteriia bacterium]MBN2839684.1 UvrD-helicase domain-containing protein [Coriobacteriia bacterium]